MPLTPHVLVTAAVALAVVFAGWWVIRRARREWDVSVVRHELGMVRHFVAARQFSEARAAHDRAERAHRAGMVLSPGDDELLRLGPMSLVEPGPPPLRLETTDPLDLIGTAVMRSVLSDSPGTLSR